jgi:hypothetical protein
MARREDRIDRHLFRKSNGFQYYIRLFKIGGCSCLTKGTANFTEVRTSMKLQESHLYPEKDLKAG